MDTELDDLETQLAPAVSAALDEQDPDLRLSGLEAAVLVVFLAAFAAAGGDPAQRDEAGARFIADLAPSLKLLEPDPENREAQQKRVQSWLATATLGASTLSAAASNTPDVTKTWITQRDERVRETHGILDGTTVAAAEFFTVKTDPPAQLSYPGQPVGPPEAWINCRCKLQVDSSPVLAAAESGGFSGSVLVALPEGDATVTYNDGDTTQVHQTIAYLGDMGNLTVEQRADLVLAAEELASEMAPFEARVAGLATLGDNQDEVAITESVELQWLRDAAVHNDVIGPIVATEDTHPTWISHVTGLDAKPGDTIRYDRVAIWFGSDSRTEFAMTGEALVASRGPGWLTNPEDTRRLHDYWTRGEGAAKIRWGTDGDFTRCTHELAEHVEPPYLKRTCAQWHFDALGYWPGELGKPGNPPDTKENRQRAAQHASAAPCTECEEPTMNTLNSYSSSSSPQSLVGEVRQDPFAITADAASTKTPKMPPPPREWFDDPKLDGPTALVVQADGRVFGHIATWGQCHIGIDGECVTAPRSASGYAYAHTGVADTSEGEVPVGVLTMGTGHADRYATASATVEHYDHTGTQAAKVRFGEDAHGIWAAGSMNLMDEGDFGRFKAASVSGDWRSIAGRLELVAALMVNVPGFPVPRPALAASGDRVTSAVGLNQVTHEGDLTSSVAAAVVAQLDRRDSRRAKLAELEPIDRMARERKLALLDD